MRQISGQVKREGVEYRRIMKYLIVKPTETNSWCGSRGKYYQLRLGICDIQNREDLAKVPHKKTAVETRSPQSGYRNVNTNMLLNNMSIDK
ncbi:Hypothetical predicted protein [Octopus vulgaris]|uniref:Uncharacterized protein n=1 Tax=Octopus vulgaris TaxID=6645 RepID=A0AA36BS20_OCTVU|nr:Hypothetical predicted protein [Octopus vulgaris]